jgi:hypothetical protein
MNIPSLVEPAWLAMLEGRNLEFEYLATRILIGRLAVTYKAEPTEEVKNDCVKEMIEFFERNQNIPKVQKDLNTIFGGALS